MTTPTSDDGQQHAETWADLDRGAPPKLRDDISLADVRAAAADADTVLDVSRTLRVHRDMTRKALGRAGLLEDLHRLNGNTLRHITITDDSDDHAEDDGRDRRPAEVNG